jgi:hypothetical protein
MKSTPSISQREPGFAGRISQANVLHQDEVTTSLRSPRLSRPTQQRNLRFIMGARTPDGWPWSTGRDCVSCWATQGSQSCHKPSDTANNTAVSSSTPHEFPPEQFIFGHPRLFPVVSVSQCCVNIWQKRVRTHPCQRLLHCVTHAFIPLCLAPGCQEAQLPKYTCCCPRQDSCLAESLQMGEVGSFCIVSLP